MRSRYVALILVPFFLCLLGAGAYYYNATRCPGITCVSFSGKERFKTTAVYENSATSYRALLDNGSVLLRVEKYRANKDDAQMYADAKSMQILGLYEDAKSPYPGMLSDVIRCENKYKPVFGQKKINGNSVTVYSGLLNDRLQYGVCVQDQLMYRSQSAMFYCQGQKSWYQLEFITRLSQQPSPDLAGYISSLRCD